MPNVYTTFATSRFIDREAVVERLRRCAAELRCRHKEVEKVYLFGSFAKGTATPRSDADVALQASVTTNEKRHQLLDSARQVFSKAPVPVDIHLIDRDEPASRYGLPALVFREAIEL